MRLIDANKLIKEYGKYDIEFMVNKQPTVDAIPMQVIEDIKAEIKDEKEFAYADFEQYKVAYLGVDAEYVEDELPFDDFRYGMERCLEIINKHLGKEQSHEVN